MPRRVSSPELVGRGRELEELEQFVTEVGSGASRVVVVAGEAGIGKSRILDEVVRRAEDAGTRAVIGRCVETGGSELPFAPLAEILRGMAGAFDKTRLPELLGPSRGELARIVPEFADRPLHATGPGGEEARSRLFAALVDAVRGVAAERPLLIGLEDLHWADRSTLDVLGFVARTLRDDPVGIVVTVRDDGLTAAETLRSLLGELTRLPHVVRLDLHPLSERAVADLLAGIQGAPPEPSAVSRIAERSGGNPFFVEELVASDLAGQGEGSVPPMIGEVVAVRLARLPEITREVVAMAAVIAEDPSHEVLASVAALPREELLRALRSAVDQHVLITSGDRYRFRHALVREVAEGELLPAERAELHRRTAEVFSARPELVTGGDTQVAAELARHWHEAGMTEQAFEASLDAAERAQRSVAPAEALAHYERALALWDAAEPGDRDRVDVLRAAAEVAEQAGEHSRAVEHLRAALEAGGWADVAREADLRQRLARAISAIDTTAAVAEAERACELAAGLGRSPVRARALAEYARQLVLDPTYTPDEAIAPAREAVAAAQAAGDREVEVEVLANLGWALGWVGRIDEALATLDEARTVAEELGDDHRRVRVAVARFVVLYVFARRDGEAREVAEELAAWLERDGHRWSTAAKRFVQHLSYFHLRSGEFDRVEQALGEMAEGRLEGYDLAWYYHVRGTMHWMRGRLADAAADVQRMRELGTVRFHHDQFPLEAEIAAAQGRVDDVRALAAEYLGVEVNPASEAMKTGALLPLVRAEVDRALAARGGDREEHLRRAKEALGRMYDLVERFPPQPGGAIQIETPATWVRLAEAELSRLTGPDPDRWRTALETISEAYWRTYARWRLAEALLASDDRDTAADELRGAHEQAVGLGAERLRADIEGLARRARISLPGLTTTDPDDVGLTAREHEVLALVAQGLSNVEIGERLYISRKTASAHVSNLLTKTGRASRTELATWAVQEGIVDVGAS